MARILDFYRIRWEYEPHTFPILWNLDGVVVESFSPDFWLPDLDLYLEMTTLRQRLVRKKNRKLRRIRELYPDIRIKLFYARDFRALMLKFGRLALVDELERHRPARSCPDADRRVTGPVPDATDRRVAAADADADLARGRSDADRPDRPRSARHRRGPPDRGADRGEGRRARRPDRSPTTAIGG